MNDEKLEKLKELYKKLEHKKVKKILKAAIDGWKNREPIQFFSGLRYWNDESFFEDDPCHNGYCLLGASLVNRKIQRKIQEIDPNLAYNSWIYFGLSKNEMFLLTNTFDGSELSDWFVKNLIEKSKNKDQAHLLIKEVTEIRKVVFNES